MHQHQQGHIIRAAIGAHLQGIAIAHRHALQRCWLHSGAFQLAREIQPALTAHFFGPLGKDKNERNHQHDHN